MIPFRLTSPQPDPIQVYCKASRIPGILYIRFPREQVVQLEKASFLGERGSASLSRNPPPPPYTYTHVSPFSSPLPPPGFLTSRGLAKANKTFFPVNLTIKNIYR